MSARNLLCATLSIAMALQGAAAVSSSAAFDAQVSFEQRLGARLPVDATWLDERGERVRLADYLGTSPALLVFSYYGCANLCPTVIRTLGARLAQSRSPVAQSVPVVVVSVDGRESPVQAAQMKAKLGSAALPQQQRWHFLTARESQIEQLTQAAGFRYAYDAGSNQFAHAAGFLLMTPQGDVARYFFGFDVKPAELEQAIAAASEGGIASPVQRLLMRCFRDNTLVGVHSGAIVSTLRAMSVACVLALPILFAVRRLRARTHRRGG